jgi:hypothetical protein
MPDRCGSRPSRDARTSRLVVAVCLAALASVAAGCGSSAASGAPTPSPTHASSIPSPTTKPSVDPSAARTFPPSQTPIEPGRYRWDGFEHAITIDLGPGWALGHDNPTFFDLFRGSDFPSITFARFDEVYVDRVARAKASNVGSVVTTLAGRADLTVGDSSTVTLGGMTGRQFDLTTNEPQTPLFFGRAGDFKLDPEFQTRYRIIDFPGGGVLVVGVHTKNGGFDAGVALGDPVVATLSVKP